ncbi:MAG: ATP-binding protein [Balneolales bacterium]
MNRKGNPLKCDPVAEGTFDESILNIFNSLPCVVLSVSIPESDVLLLTETAAEHFGEPFDTLLNDVGYWKKVIHPGDKPIIRKIDRQLKSNGSYDEEYRIRIRSGQVKWVHHKGEIVYKDSEPVRLDRIFTDITDRKQTAYQLKTQEDRYRNIITNMNLGYLEVDNNDIIKFANQTFTEMSGYGLEELKGKKASELFLSKKSRQLASEKNRTREDGKSDSYEINVRNKHGELRNWLISGAPNYNEQGEVTGSVGIHLDVTAKFELKKAKEHAEGANRAKSEFLANMSHEIRTPLNAVIGFTDLLKRTPLDETQKQYMSNVFTSAHSLLDIISDILDFSKIEAGKLELDIDRTDLRHLSEQVRDIIRYQAQEKALELIVNTPPDLPRFIWTDSVRLRQVLVNLLSNAIKFTEKGIVEFKIEETKKTKKGKTQLRFSVSDTGIGIEPHNQQKIFEAFLQEDSSTTRNFGGTGLGLSIANNLLALMHSKLELKSDPGKGSTFYFDVAFDSEADDSDGLEKTG